MPLMRSKYFRDMLQWGVLVLLKFSHFSAELKETGS